MGEVNHDHGKSYIALSEGGLSLLLPQIFVQLFDLGKNIWALETELFVRKGVGSSCCWFVQYRPNKRFRRCITPMVTPGLLLGSYAFPPPAQKQGSWRYVGVDMVDNVDG